MEEETMSAKGERVTTVEGGVSETERDREKRRREREREEGEREQGI